MHTKLRTDHDVALWAGPPASGLVCAADEGSADGGGGGGSQDGGSGDGGDEGDGSEEDGDDKAAKTYSQAEVERMIAEAREKTAAEVRDREWAAARRTFQQKTQGGDGGAGSNGAGANGARTEEPRGEPAKGKGGSDDVAAVVRSVLAETLPEALKPVTEQLGTISAERQAARFDEAARPYGLSETAQARLRDQAIKLGVADFGKYLADLESDGVIHKATPGTPRAAQSSARGLPQRTDGDFVDIFDDEVAESMSTDDLVKELERQRAAARQSQGAPPRPRILDAKLRG